MQKYDNNFNEGLFLDPIIQIYQNQGLTVFTGTNSCKCTGYADIVAGSGATFECIYRIEDSSMEELSGTAKVLLQILKRLEVVNEDKDLMVQGVTSE